jgi:biofilm PGA synthesis N-glycosyltransferase PgaC
MKAVFWLSVGIVFYAYFGYAALLWIWARLHPRPVQRGRNQPSVSVIMVVRNEETNLRRKLANLLGLNYPQDRMEFIVVSDGSSDGSEEILSQAARDKRFRVLTFSESKGKAQRLNEALSIAKGEIALFMDARQEVEPDALRLMIENFADTAVGCVSGELMLGDRDSGEAEKGMGIYWRIEKKVREQESASGSVVGATGALYCARTALLAPIPSETILDDVLLPLGVAKRGGRVIFDGRARAWDVPDLGGRREFQRKVRTLTGNYQLLQIAPWVIGSANPLLFRFISHKLTRLVAPFALVGMLIASAANAQPFYRIALILQLAFYAFSLLALSTRQIGALSRLAHVALTFVVLNAAAIVAFSNFVTRRKEVWVR